MDRIPTEQEVEEWLNLDTTQWYISALLGNQSVVEEEALAAVTVADYSKASYLTGMGAAYKQITDSLLKKEQISMTEEETDEGIAYRIAPVGEEG